MCPEDCRRYGSSQVVRLFGHCVATTQTQRTGPLCVRTHKGPVRQRSRQPSCKPVNLPHIGHPTSN